MKCPSCDLRKNKQSPSWSITVFGDNAGDGNVDVMLAKFCTCGQCLGSIISSVEILWYQSMIVEKSGKNG